MTFTEVKIVLESLKTKNIVRIGIIVTVIILVNPEVLCVVYIIYGTKIPNEIPVVIHIVTSYFSKGLYPLLELT